MPDYRRRGAGSGAGFLIGALAGEAARVQQGGQAPAGSRPQGSGDSGRKRKKGYRVSPQKTRHKAPSLKRDAVGDQIEANHGGEGESRGWSEGTVALLQGASQWILSTLELKDLEIFLMLTINRQTSPLFFYKCCCDKGTLAFTVSCLESTVLWARV